MRLRPKLLLTLFPLIALPLIIFCGGTYWYIIDSQKERATQHLAQLTAEVNQSVAAQLQQLQSDTQLIAENQLLTQYLQIEPEHRVNILQPAILNLFANYQKNNPQYFEIRLMLPNGFEETRLSNSWDDNISNNEFYQAYFKDIINADSNTGIFTYINPDSNQLALLSYYKLIRTERVIGTTRTHKKLVGLVLLSGSLDNLLDTEQSINQIKSHYGLIFVDKDLQPLFKQDNEVQTLWSRLQNDQQQREMQIARQQVLLETPLDNVDIKVASFIDTSAINHQSITTVIGLIGIIIMTMAIVSLIIFAKINEILLSPILKLTRATKQLIEGKLDTDIDIQSKDELGELALTFKRMSNKLSRSNERISQLAYYDNLTGLPNRHTLKESLKALIKRATRNKTQVAVLFIDLDDFKKVNDAYGHQAGDNLLIEVSKRLRSCLRSNDVINKNFGIAPVFDNLVSRRGGDEFNIVLSDINGARDAAHVAERIIIELTAPFNTGGSAVHISASIGIALFPDDGTNSELLLRNADMAMYDAKSLGKNNYQIFTESINTQVHQRLQIEHAIHHALEKNEFTLHYQPKYSLRTLKVSGFEALIRWNHPERGLLSPVEFIPIAEETNLINDIGRWVLAEAFLQLSNWHGMLPPGCRVAVNLSAKSLLRTLPIDTVKIDRSFVKDMHSNYQNRAITDATLQLCRHLSLQTVAEGVETDEQLRALSHKGCDSAQGFLLAKPMPPEHAIKQLEWQLPVLRAEEQNELEAN